MDRELEKTKISNDIVEKAFKKLKSSVYYDKTQLHLRNRIVEFEMEHSGKRLDNYLKNTIYRALIDEDKYEKLIARILQEIKAVYMPKTVSVSSNSDIITNQDSKSITVNKIQYYIDMPVEGHILGVLWIMLMGNRIRKKLINELSKEPTYSPYLFEPYFEQYESWRDKAMEEAQQHMRNKQDVVIITMDFKRYYYSLDIDENVMQKVFDAVFTDEEFTINQEFRMVCERLNSFVEKVIDKYSQEFGDRFEKRKILPIGFLPSNVLGNWCLNRFDKAIIDGWNPIYYGRYVDDILIVDKVEKNSDLYSRISAGNKAKKDIIDFFLTSCSRLRKVNGVCGKCENNSAILISKPVNENTEMYYVNEQYNPVDNNESKIEVQQEKLKIFYFKWEESDALITCFKNNIAKNKSEFRHLPEDEAVFHNDDYSDIYMLKNEDTVNKLRGIEEINIDKYELSKFLGKYLRIAGMIKDKSESRFEKDILKIFNYKAIIENYSMWEKVVEILVINERFKALGSFCEKVNEAVQSIKVASECEDSHLNEKEQKYAKESIQKSLYIHLHACLTRSFALVWKKTRKEIEEKIYKGFLGEKVGTSEPKLIEGYCRTRMMDKSVMPIMIDVLQDNIFDISSGINLTHFDEVINKINKGDEKWQFKYKYYPFAIGLYDFGLISCIKNLSVDKPNGDLEEILKNELAFYAKANYKLRLEDFDKKDLLEVVSFKNRDNVYCVSVGNGKKSELRIAVANVRLNPVNFEKIIKGVPDRSYSRYKEMSQLVNAAIDSDVDMLIMPEAYVPFEWLSTLARTCAKNSLAVVTGVEHIKCENRIYNYTAVILPYLEEGHRCAYISFHLKKHYAPSEKEKILGYRMSPVEGKNHELYKWNDCYFPVYCCYELTSITERALFQSYADMIVAVEWNKDVKYYSNILESLSRDIHCYCVQVNSSEYGDSRITKPSKSEEKDLIRTKGGINSSILVEDISIRELRDYQLKEYSLQQKDLTFKTTPPTFNKDIVLAKIRGEELFN